MLTLEITADDEGMVPVGDSTVIELDRYIEALRRHLDIRSVVKTPEGARVAFQPTLEQQKQFDDGMFRVLAFGSRSECAY